MFLTILNCFPPSFMLFHDIEFSEHLVIFSRHSSRNYPLWGIYFLASCTSFVENKVLNSHLIIFSSHLVFDISLSPVISQTGFITGEICKIFSTLSTPIVFLFLCCLADDPLKAYIFLQIYELKSPYNQYIPSTVDDITS